MIKKNTTMYSIVGSLGAHMLLTLGAGSFLLNINSSVQPPKTYKLEFVKRKTPPPVKKEKIQPVRREIKVASLQPKAMPVLQPRARVQPTRQVRPVVPAPSPVSRQVQRAPVMKSAVMRTTTRPTISRRVNVPVARSFAVSSKTAPAKGATRMAMVQGKSRFIPRNIPQRVVRASSGTPSSRGTKRVAMVQGTKHSALRSLPKRVVARSGSSSPSRATGGRVVPVQSGVRLASLSLPSPRGVPNIVDRGALKSYIGRVKRSIEGAKQYPEASRKAGRQGKLKIQFTILKNGQVDNVRLLTRTPYANLNREAMAAVKRAAPFSGFPDSMMEKSLQVILPFRFELN